MKCSAQTWNSAQLYFARRGYNFPQLAIIQRPHCKLSTRIHAVLRLDNTRRPSPQRHAPWSKRTDSERCTVAGAGAAQGNSPAPPQPASREGMWTEQPDPTVGPPFCPFDLKAWHLASGAQPAPPPGARPAGRRRPGREAHRGLLHGRMSQISSAYSLIVRSLLNLPVPAVLRMLMRAQRAGSTYERSTRACASK